jgi:hypothetical protein
MGPLAAHSRNVDNHLSRGVTTTSADSDCPVAVTVADTSSVRMQTESDASTVSPLVSGCIE